MSEKWNRQPGMMYPNQSITVEPPWTVKVQTQNYPDNQCVLYTSDYGSYSSQESNHSGNNYSNLTDCEEILNSPCGLIDRAPIPPPKTCAMNSNKEKPLPPPRITSKAQQILPKKTEALFNRNSRFSDDHSVAKSGNANDTVHVENPAPSFATLPRKKSLSKSGNPSLAANHSVAQTSWMKDISMKEETMRMAENARLNIAEKEHQHTKLPSNAVNSKQSNYINRNQVQKVLLQQQKASLNRRSVDVNSLRHQYSSVPSLKTSNPQHQYQTTKSSKAWECDLNSGSNISTAVVLGIIEPPSIYQNLIAHNRQGSADTEFEFPPPPSDIDMEQMLNSVSLTKQTPRERWLHEQQLQTQSNRPHTNIPAMNKDPHHQPAQKHQFMNNQVKLGQAGDIVLPPPLQFQEENRTMPVFYTCDDYETLSVNATVPTHQYTSGPVLQRHTHDQTSSGQTRYNPHQRVNQAPTNSQRNTNVTDNHYYQYSTEL